MIEQTSDRTFKTNSRGVSYYLRLDACQRWEVWSRRDALGPSNVGTIRHFENLVQVGNAVKAFAGIEKLVTAEQSPQG